MKKVLIACEESQAVVKEFRASGKGGVRSKTFQGIARAMAEQWGDFIK